MNGSGALVRGNKPAPSFGGARGIQLFFNKKNLTERKRRAKMDRVDCFENAKLMHRVVSR